MISMDGKGRWADNVWIERIWRTIKYECIFLNGIENLSELKTQLHTYIDYYNNKRLHSSLGYKTPTSYYENSRKLNKNDKMVLCCEFNNYKQEQLAA